MDEGNRDVPPARRHLIERPRLTRMLDETSARIILLVAPAGYGKTTLARQWLEGRGEPYVWYTATEAARDVAVLASGLARELAVVAPYAGERIRSRLRVQGDPPSPDALAELLLDEIVDFPPALVIDDHHLAPTRDSEALLQRVIQDVATRVVVIGRTPPPWISARAILYGDAFEIDASLLAFTREEATRLFRDSGRMPNEGLLSLADGWPAALGLASMGRGFDLPEGGLTAPLHQYIAQECLASVSEDVRDCLRRVAVASTPSEGLLRHFAHETTTTLREAEELGLYASRGDGSLEFHPLLLRYLRHSLSCASDRELVASSAVQYFLDQEAWDEAFSIAIEHGLNDLAAEVLRDAFPSLLADGRLSTASDWVQKARAAGEAALLDLVEAEIAFAAGHTSRAYSLASYAAERLTDVALAARAHACAGWAAYHLDHLASSKVHLHAAEAKAADRDQLRRARWGLFLAYIETDPQNAPPMVEALADAGSMDDPSHILLVHQARLEYALRVEGVEQALREAETARHLVDRVSDPQRRTGFLFTCAWASNSSANYRAGLRLSRRVVAEAARHHFRLALPHAYVAEAAALTGLRRYDAARRSLRSAKSISRHAHVMANAACVEARILLASGDPTSALASLALPPPTPLAPVMEGEFWAVRAVAAACAGELAEAQRCTAAAHTATTASEARAACAAADAIVDLQRGAGALSVRRLLACAEETGLWDAVVSAWRGHRALLHALAAEGAGTRLRQILPTAEDERIAAHEGLIAHGDSASVLSTREKEVHRLLAQGLRNREIAQTLFISEVTVKVHVRRILQKLEVRSRTEAALLYEDDSRRG